MPMLRPMVIQNLRQNLRVNFCLDSDLYCHPSAWSNCFVYCKQKGEFVSRDAAKLNVFRKDINDPAMHNRNWQAHGCKGTKYLLGEQTDAPKGAAGFKKDT